MDDDVSAVAWIRGPSDHVVPGKNDLSDGPRLPGKDAPIVMHQAKGVGSFTAHEERTRVQQDLRHAGEVVGAPVQQQQARLGGHDDAHFFGDFQASTSDERLLGHEHLDVLLQLKLKIGGQGADQRDPPPEDVTPRGRERFGAHARSLPASEQRFAKQPDDHRGEGGK